ncbi:hypothetical protein CHU98_g401 [Xylaria longipes]|nr:hypothetical protein CHU98_g401 [Xylaria longipes]
MPFSESKAAIIHVADNENARSSTQSPPSFRAELPSPSPPGFVLTVCGQLELSIPVASRLKDSIRLLWRNPSTGQLISREKELNAIWNCYEMKHPRNVERDTGQEDCNSLSTPTGRGEIGGRDTTFDQEQTARPACLGRLRTWPNTGIAIGLWFRSRHLRNKIHRVRNLGAHLGTAKRQFPAAYLGQLRPARILKWPLLIRDGSHCGQACVCEVPTEYVDRTMRELKAPSRYWTARWKPSWGMASYYVTEAGVLTVVNWPTQTLDIGGQWIPRHLGTEEMRPTGSARKGNVQPSAILSTSPNSSLPREELHRVPPLKRPIPTTPRRDNVAPLLSPFVHTDRAAAYAIVHDYIILALCRMDVGKSNRGRLASDTHEST